MASVAAPAAAPPGIRIHEDGDADDAQGFAFGGGDFDSSPEEPEPPEKASSSDGGTHSARTPATTGPSFAIDDAHTPAPSTASSHNLRASRVRDSLDIPNHAAVSYIERKCLGDRTELGKSNATERTVDTAAESGTSDDDDNDNEVEEKDEKDHDEEAEFEPPTAAASSTGSPAPPRYDQPMQESTLELLRRRPAKSAMVHKTLESSLSTTYESTRRKMARQRKLEAQRARKLARARAKNTRNGGGGSHRRLRLKKAISRMTLASRRNLFEVHEGAPADGSGGRSSSKRESRRASRASQRSGLSRSLSSADLPLSASEHRAYEEEHNDRLTAMPMAKMDRRASLGSFKSTGSGPRPTTKTNEDHDMVGGDDANTNDNNSSAGSFQNRSVRSMRSMRNLFSTSRTKLLLGTSLSSLFSHGSRSECFTLDDDDDDNHENEAGLFPTLLAFDTVQIREYDPEVDANPCTARGPALTLGWRYTTSQPVDLHQYETHRPPRRQMKEMRLPREVREQRLMASGVSRSEMERSIKAANLARQRRSKTLRQLRHCTLHERLEGMKKKCLKLAGRRKSHEEEERRLWEEAQYYFGP